MIFTWNARTRNVGNHHCLIHHQYFEFLDIFWELSKRETNQWQRIFYRVIQSNDYLSMQSTKIKLSLCICLQMFLLTACEERQKVQFSSMQHCFVQLICVIHDLSFLFPIFCLHCVQQKVLQVLNINHQRWFAIISFFAAAWQIDIGDWVLKTLVDGNWIPAQLNCHLKNVNQDNNWKPLYLRTKNICFLSARNILLQEIGLIIPLLKNN